MSDKSYLEIASESRRNTKMDMFSLKTYFPDLSLASILPVLCAAGGGGREGDPLIQVQTACGVWV